MENSEKSHRVSPATQPGARVVLGESFLSKVEVTKIQHGLYKQLNMVHPICYSSTTPQ